MPQKRKLDVKKVIRQRLDKGMSLQEIADNNGVCKQAVSQLLQKVTDNQVLGAYKSKRADVYATLEHEILNSVDADTIKESSLLQRVTAAGILKTHENIETGKGQNAVSDVDIRILIQSISTPSSDNGSKNNTIDQE